MHFFQLIQLIFFNYFSSFSRLIKCIFFKVFKVDLGAFFQRIQPTTFLIKVLLFKFSSYDIAMKRYLQALAMFISGIVLIFIYFEIVLRYDFPDIPMKLFVYGAFVEESIKFLFALIALRCGVKPLTIAFLGLGYGFGEQLTHFWYPTGYASFYTHWMHATAGVAMAILLERAVRLKTIKSYFLAYFAPLSIHAVFNWILLALLWWYS